MSDYTFMKSGFDNVQDAVSEEEAKQNAVALIVAFAEGAIKTAGKYVTHAERKGVTPEDLKRAMMLEMFFFKRRPDIVEQAEKIKQEIFSQDEMDEIDEVIDVEEDDIEEFAESACECPLCKCINGIYSRWENWEPESPMEVLFKKQIEEMC